MLKKGTIAMKGKQIACIFFLNKTDEKGVKMVSNM